MKNRKQIRWGRGIALLASLALLLSLLGCHEATPTEPALQSTPPASTAPMEPGWPAAVPEDTQLFQLFQYNGSLKINWQTADQKQNIWLSDPENNTFFVKSLDYDQFYDATFWIRLELTQAGRHYCDESWSPLLTALVSPERGKSLEEPLKDMMVIPYYDSGDHAALAGWIVFGRIRSSVPVELELTGAAGGQTQKVWLAPSVANTYIDQDLFAVTKIKEQLEITKVSGSLCSLQWEGNTYYFAAAEQGMPETAVRWFMVTPDQALLQSETMLEIGLQEYMPVHGLGNPLFFRFTGNIRLYADPELTELVHIYVYCGEEYVDHVYLSLRWTAPYGVEQCTKVITYTPSMG